MATYIRGKSGLLEELETRRNRRQGHLATLTTKARRAQLEAEVGVFNELIGWFGQDSVHVLTEAEYDRHTALGADATIGAGSPYVERECSNCSSWDRVLATWETSSGHVHINLCIACRRAIMKAPRSQTADDAANAALADVDLSIKEAK